MTNEAFCAFVLMWGNGAAHSQLNQSSQSYSFNNQVNLSSGISEYGFASADPNNCYLTYCKVSGTRQSWLHISDKGNISGTCFIRSRGQQVLMSTPKNPALFELSLNNSRFIPNKSNIYDVNPKAKMVVLGNSNREIYISSDLIKQSDQLRHWAIKDISSNTPTGGIIYSTGEGVFVKKAIELAINHLPKLDHLFGGFVNSNGALFLTEKGHVVLVNLKTNQFCEKNLSSSINPTDKRLDLAKSACHLLDTSIDCPNFDDKSNSSLLVDIYRFWGNDISKLDITCSG